MSTEIKEPFPLFPITPEERETLLKVAAFYVDHPSTAKGICSILGYLPEDLSKKIEKAIYPHSYYSDYLGGIGRTDLAYSPAKSRLHWLRLLINQPTIEDLEEKHQHET